MAITYAEWQSWTVISQNFPEMTEIEMLQFQEMALCTIGGLDCLLERCRLQGGALAIAHVAEIMTPGCGVSGYNVKSIKNESDAVTFGTRSVSELEATKWGFMLRELLRSCTCNPGLLYTTDPWIGFGGGCC